MRKGVELLSEQRGDGPVVRRHAWYRIKLRMWLRRGDPVRWPTPGVPEIVVEDDGTTLITEVRIDRVSLIPGLFYGIEGMCVGGTRVLRVAPHLAYGSQGQANMMIPENAVLKVELSVLAERAT